MKTFTYGAMSAILAAAPAWAHTDGTLHSHGAEWAIGLGVIAMAAMLAMRSK